MRRIFKKGDIVWGQAIDSPIWPAQVTELVKYVVYDEMPDNLYEVVFFNDNSKAVLRGSSIFDFNKYKARFHRSAKTKSFKEAVREADEKIKRIREYGPSLSVDFGKYHSRARKREQSLSPSLPKREKILTVYSVENDLPSRTKKREPSFSPLLGKRKRISVGVDGPKNFRRFDDRLDADSPQYKKGRKKVKREFPIQHEKIEPIVESLPDKKIDQYLIEKLRSKILEPPSDPITDAFRELRRRVDSVTTRLFTTSEGDMSRVSSNTLEDLDEIIKLLKEGNLKIQDLMVTRTSNMLVFIIKALSKREECKAVVAQINKEVAKMKESLLKEFETTEKYDVELEELRRERALAEALADAEEND